MDQVYSPELEAQQCGGGEQEHESCIVTLGYCPYCQPAIHYPGEPMYNQIRIEG